MSEKTIDLLLIEDNPGDMLILKTYLMDSAAETGFDFNIVNAPTLGRSLEILSGREFGVILLDLTLPDSESRSYGRL